MRASTVCFDGSLGHVVYNVNGAMKRDGESGCAGGTTVESL